MSFLWHGLTDAGAQVPIQVDAQGRVIAVDGTPGVSNWERTGTTLSPAVPGDDVFTSGDVKVGNTTAAPTIGLNADGTASFKSQAVNIDDSGRLLVGTSTARTNYFNTSAYGPLLNLEGTSNSNRVLSFVHNDISGAPILVLGATGGSSAGSNSLISSDGGCGTLSFQGADGSQLVEAARIACEIDGTTGANDMPGRLVFSTTAAGTSVPTVRLTIDSAGGATFTGNVTAPNITFRSLDPSYYGKNTGDYSGPEVSLIDELVRLETLVNHLYQELGKPLPAQVTTKATNLMKLRTSSTQGKKKQ